MILRSPITPGEYGGKRGRPVSTPYGYLIGCDNELAKIHTCNPGTCDKVGGVIIMHMDDLRKFALLWLHKTEEVRADKARCGTNFTGDIYSSGWISEMYGYSFGAAELNLRHIIKRDILIYPGYIPEPGVKYRVFHYGLRFSVGDWSFDKADWRNTDMVNTCWAKIPDPLSILSNASENDWQRDLLSIECGQALNEALLLHHERRNCRPPNAIFSDLEQNKGNDQHMHSSRKMFVPIDATNSSLFHISSSKQKSPPRTWMIGLWALSVVGFLAVISMVFSRHRQERLRFKSNRLKKSHAGFSNANGRSDTESHSDA